MNETTNSKKSPLLVVLCLLLCCSVAVSCVTMISGLQTKKQVNFLSEAIGAKVDVGGEDDVTIAEEYVIRSTKQISDAYLNGTEDKLNDRDKETLSMAKAVLDKIIKDGMTDYEKEEACYLWLCKEMKSDDSILTVIHDTDRDADNPFGVLKFHNAVCVGYATTMRLFMQMLGIECMVIHSSDLIHSWDLVKLDDEWYHVDCYSDSDMLYGNFNMDDEAAEENHDWNHEFFPAATGTRYSYAAQNAVEIKNIYAIPKWVKHMLDKDERVGACTFKEKITPETEAEAAAMVRILVDAIQSIEKYSEDYYFEPTWSKNADDEYVLMFRIGYYGDEEDDKISDELREKIQQRITDVFGDAVSFYNDDDYSDDYVETTTVFAKG